MNYILQAIPNGIYNSVDACKNAKDMREQIKRLMFGFDVTSHVRHSRLMDEFDKIATKEGESLESVYERLTTLNHDLLAILAHSNASSSPSHANSTYSPQPYYVIHPSSVVDYEDDYQGKLQGDYKKDKLTNAIMLLARAITQKFFTPTNNHLHTLSDTRNQVVVSYDRVDIQTKNAAYGGNGNRNTGRQNKNQAFNAGNGNDDSNQIVQLVSETKSTLGKPNVQSMKDEAESNLKEKENDFLLDNSYAEETMEELTTTIMLMARIQLTDGNAETVPSYDAKAVKNNDGTSDHDSNDHDEYHEIQMLASKKAFKERENRFLENIVDLEEKLSSHDRIVYDPFLIARLGYKNPERLKKAIAAQPKMYDGERLHSAKLTIDSPDLEETLKDVTYFSIPSTFNNGSESKEVTSDLAIPEMPKESKLLKMFGTMGIEINGLRSRIDKTFLEDIQRRWMSDSQNSLREFYKTDVILMFASLLKNLKEIKEELIEEVYFLRIKDEALDMIIDFINQVQKNLKSQILTIRTDIETDYKNEKLWAFYAKLANTGDNEHTSSSSSIVVEANEAPQIVSSFINHLKESLYVNYKYTMDILKKQGKEKCNTINTPMAIAKLAAYLQDTQVDQTKYPSMIGGLMYLVTIMKSTLKTRSPHVMSSIEDIQCAHSDTRPPMLDRTDFASWQQCIRLYCWGKENRVNILKSIDEGPFQMGTVREPLAEGTKGASHLGPERPRVYSDLSPKEKDRYNANCRETNILLQGLPKDVYTLINHYTDAKDIWDNVKMLLEGSELTKEDWES
nr:integrase, catalytic region, zinc finger, CCHC-type, peptidase aspartic, catalytic [Tanacetum cinerariifolium]